MFESLVLNVLNSYLGAYVEGLNKDQLRIAVWAGDVQMQGLRLRADALRSLGFPIVVKAGHIGQLKLVIPWSQLSSKPVTILIDDLFLLAVPAAAGHFYDADKEQAAADAAKAAGLATADAELKQAESDHDAAKKYTMVEQILDNLTLKINKVHLRYEDSETCPAAPFAAGISMAGLSVTSTDAEWRATFVQQQQVTAHKLLDMQKLIAYWNPSAAMVSQQNLSHEELSKLFHDFHSEVAAGDAPDYILEPVNLTARLRRRKREGGPGSMPRIVVDVLLDAIRVRLSRSQIENAILLQNRFAAHDAAARRQKQRFSRIVWWRPRARIASCATAKAGKAKSAGASKSETIRAWWQYAQKAVTLGLLGVGNAPPFFIDAVKLQRRSAIRAKYRQLWVRKMTADEVTKADQEATLAFESTLPLEDILMFRSDAQRTVDGDGELAELARVQSSKTHSNRSWVAWAFSRSAAGSTSGGEARRGATGKGGVASAGAAEKAGNDPAHGRNCVGVRLLFTLQSGSVELVEDETGRSDPVTPESVAHSLLHRRRPRRLHSLVILSASALRFSLEHLPDSNAYRLGLVLRELAIRDLQTKGTVFPVLVGSKLHATNSAVENTSTRADKGGTDLAVFDQGPHLAQDPPAWIATPNVSTTSPVFFRASFESHPEGTEADYRLRLFTQPLDVVLNHAVISSVMSFFANPSLMPSSEIERTLLDDTVVADAESIALLHEANDDERQAVIPSFDIFFDICAPEIIIPQNVCSPTSPIVVVGLGRLTVVRECNVVARDGSGGAVPTAETRNIDEEFVTPPMTPPQGDVSDASDADTADRIAQVADRLSDDFYTFELELSDVQVLVADASQPWRESLKEDASEMHVLERLSVECKVVQSKTLSGEDGPDVAVTRVNSTLQKMQLQLTESKVIRLNSCLSALAEPVKSESRSEEPASPRLHEDHSDSFFALGLAPKQSARIRQKPMTSYSKRPRLEASFSVSEMVVSISARSSMADLVEPLVDARVVGVDFTLSRQHFAERLDFAVVGFTITDLRRPAGSDFAELASTTSADDDTAFVRLKYVKLLPGGSGALRSRYTTGDRDTAAPSHQRIPQTMEVSFNTLNLSVNRYTIAALLDFFHGSFPARAKGPARHGGVQGAGATSPPPSPEHPYPRSSTPTSPQDNVRPESSRGGGRGPKFKLSIDIAQMNVTLVEHDNGLARAAINGTTFCYVSFQGSNQASGILGKVTVLDLTPAGSLYREFFETSGKEVLSFEFISSSGVPESRIRATVIIKMASVLITYTNRFVNRLTCFYHSFNEIKEFFQYARRAAEGLVAELDDTVSYIRWDISIDCPVLTLPRNSFSEDILQADLGHMKIINSLEAAPRMPSHLVNAYNFDDNGTQSLVESFQVTIKDLHLYSMKQPMRGRPPPPSQQANQEGNPSPAPNTFASPRTPAEALAKEKVLGNCALHVRWDRKLDQRRTDCANNTMHCEISGVDMYATQSQYDLLMGFLGENLGCERDMLWPDNQNEPQPHADSDPPAETATFAGDSLNTAQVDTAVLSDFSSPAVGSSRASGSTAHATSSSGNPPPQLIQFDFKLDINDASLQLFQDGFKDPEGQWIPQSPLARLDLIDSTLSFASFSNGLQGNYTSSTTLYCKAIRVHDTRPCTTGKEDAFSQVLRPVGVEPSEASSNDTPLLQVTYRSSQRLAKLSIVLYKTRVILPPIPWLSTLKQWIFDLPQSQLKLQQFIDDGLTAAPTSIQNRDDKPDIPRYMDINISVTDPEFVVVLDRFRADTSAFVLRMHCAVLKYQYAPDGMRDPSEYPHSRKDKSGNISHVEAQLLNLEIFSCRLNDEARTALSIVDPCKLYIYTHRHFSPDLKDITSDFTVDVLGATNNPVLTRFSYHDFRLFLLISKTTLQEMKNRPGSNRNMQQQLLQRRASSSGDDLQWLIGLGFPIGDCVVALSKAAGSVERAAVWLCRRTQNRSATAQEAGVNAPPYGMHDDSMFFHATSNPPDQIRAEAAADQHPGVDSLSASTRPCNADANRAPGLADLLSLGFSEQLCLLALDEAGGVLENAAIWLLDHGEDLALSDVVDSQAANQISMRTRVAQQEAPLDVLDVVETMSVAIRAPAFSFFLIDDFDGRDLPLMEIRLDEANASLSCKFQSDSSTVDARCRGKAGIEYFDSALSAWEPFVEPWPWSMSVGMTRSAVNVRADSIRRLELNLTPALVSSVSSTLTSWSTAFKENKPIGERSRFVGYRVRNSTGCPAKFWCILGQAPKSATKRLSVGAEVDMDFEIDMDFDDGATRRRHAGWRHKTVHKMAIKIDGWHEVHSPVTVDRVGTFVFSMRPVDPAARDPTRIVVSVTVQDGRKMIDVHSALVLENKLSVPMEIFAEAGSPGHQEGAGEPLPTLAPYSTAPVPVHLTQCVLKLRPSGRGHGWSNKGLEWKSFPTAVSTKRFGVTLACPPSAGTGGGEEEVGFRLCVSVVRQPYPLTPFRCVGHIVTLLAPVTVENLLPCPLEYHCVKTPAGGELAAGVCDQLFTVDLNEPLAITLRMPGFHWSEKALLSDPRHKYDDAVRLIDKEGRPLVLILAHSRTPGSGGARHLSVYAPYWFVNHTNLPLEYKQSHGKQIAAGQRSGAEARCSPEPFVFSCDKETMSSENYCKVRVGSHGNWGPELPIDVVGRTGRLVIEGDRNVYELGVEVNRGQGRFHQTKVITLMPRYAIVNATKYVLEFMQMHAPLASREQLKPSGQIPFHWPRPEDPHRMCIRFATSACEWSTSFPIRDVGSFHIKVRESRSTSNPVLFHIEIRLAGAAVQVILSEAEFPPFRIDNQSLVPIKYHQQGVKHVATVGPETSVPYTWDDLTEELLLVLCVHGAPYSGARAYDLDRVHECAELHYPQYFYILGPDSMALGAERQSSAVAEEFYTPCLCPRKAGDPMQHWQSSKRGQLWNKAGYVLEVAPNAPTGLQLRKLRDGTQPSERQCWVFKSGWLLNFNDGGRHSSSDGIGARALSVTSFNSLQLVRAGAEPRPEESFSKHHARPGCGNLLVRVTAEGPTRVLLIKDKNLEEAAPNSDWTLMGRHGAELPMDASFAEVGGADGGSRDRTVTLKLDMPAGIGLSTVQHEELAYLSTKDIQLTYTTSRSAVTLEVSVQHVQIDNQLEEQEGLAAALFPQFTQVDSPPAFQLTVARALEGSNSYVFKQFDVDIQPFTIRVQDVLLLRLLALVRSVTQKTDPNVVLGATSELAASTRSALEASGASRGGAGLKNAYFEVLRINAVRMNISLLTSARLPPELQGLKREYGLGVMTRFEDALIYLDAFVLERPFVSSSSLLGLISAHYKQEMLRQVYRVIGSADFLGNPIGVLNNVGLGLQEFASEVRTSGNVIGGGISLTRHVAHGLADSASKITGSISTALGAAAMDQDYQVAREKLRAKDKDFTGHIASGISGLTRGIFSGIVGVITQPIKGAQEDGIGGLGAGIMKGAVGAVTKPLAGAFDMMSSTTAAVRYTAGRKKVLIQRARPPRAIGPDQTLRVFSAQDADGRMQLLNLLRTSNKPLECFVAKLQLDADGSRELMITSDRILILGEIASGGTGITCEIWFSGLYSYKVVLRDEKIYLHFTVSREMATMVQECLELEASRAVMLHEATWTESCRKIVQAVPCGDQRIAEDALRQIQFAFVFFSERSVAMER